ncbi:type II toxin-antitoxin system RelE/ParE family toxin [Changchengzhania lutea]|uniref:type II toxin-antitoxin system RelE/ParE family toxin n=1 Tax=Changchengzhania lutea TaxID=2049305 RepID=UPI00115CB1B8|nr:type II toxin-antitoxin system RelE/ParE family toxin [Changchengzhania lutea]
MASKLTIEPEAQIEIEEAIDWYESKQTGLGEEFYNYLDGYFKTLKEATSLFPIKRKPVFRELPLKRFPYVIIYEHTESEIFVYSVFNTHQDPIKKIK